MCTSTCYIERLPPEIAGLVCHFIDEKDVPSLRVVCKFWNDIATLFFPKNINLVFEPESFQRLLDISWHPVISKQMTSLNYEPNTLMEYPTQDAWEGNIIDDSYMQDFESRGLMLVSASFAPGDATWPKSARGLVVITPKATPKKLIENTLECNTDDEILSPNAGGDYCGIPFMRSLLLAMHEAGVKPNVLQLGSVDWKFLRQSDEILEGMKGTLHNLTTLELAISTGINGSENEIGVEIPICRSYLSKNATLSDFLAAASNLKDLTIGFDWYEPWCAEPWCAAELYQIFGSTTWPCLESIAWENIDAASENWNSFFERHATTLKHVTMRTVRLQEGTWIEALEKMKKVLSLKSAYIRGDMIGENLPQYWGLETDTWVDHSDMPSQGNRTSKAIQEFLVQGGSCPLLDEDVHPQRGW